LDSKNLWSGGGLIYDAMFIACVNSFVSPMVNYFSPWYAVKLCKRSSLRKNFEKSVVTQGEANALFEGDSLELANKYAHAIKIIWTVGFYSPLLPAMYIVGIFAFLWAYWIDKYLVVRRYARPTTISSDLNNCNFL